jgi:signal-transduction protein with cAMP-binding, CBS, and nucleotidyltransferase domain
VLLRTEQPEGMQGRGMARLPAQQGQIALLRLGQAAVPVQLRRLGERLREAVAGVRVADAMSQPATVPGWLTVQLLLEQSRDRTAAAGFVTHGLSGEPEGLATLQALRMVAPQRRLTTRIAEVAVPLSTLPTAAPSDFLSEVLPRLTQPNGGRALVVDHGRMVGMVSPADVAQLLARLRGAPARMTPTA